MSTPPLAPEVYARLRELISCGPHRRNHVIAEVMLFVTPAVAVRAARSRRRKVDDPRHGDPVLVGSRLYTTRALKNLLRAGVATIRVDEEGTRWIHPAERRRRSS